MVTSAEPLIVGCGSGYFTSNKLLPTQTVIIDGRGTSIQAGMRNTGFKRLIPEVVITMNDESKFYRYRV